MDLDWKFTTALCIFISMLSILMVYNRRIAPYSKFPFAIAIFEIICLRFGRKYQNRGLPMTSIVFQELDRVLKKHETDGVFVVWLHKPFLLIFGEEAVKTFYQESDAVDKSSYSYKIVEDFLGNGILTSNGIRWKTHRKLYNIEFNQSFLKNNISNFNKHAAIMVKRLTAVAEEPSVELDEYIFFCSLSVIWESTIGEHRKENAALLHRVHNVINKLSKFTCYRITNVTGYWKFMMNFSLTGWKNLKFYKEWNDLIMKIVTQLKNEMVSQNTEKTDANSFINYDHHAHKPFMQKLLEMHQQDPSFTIQDVADELKTLLTAGNDTVAITFIWSMFMLGLHEGIQEKLYKEIEQLGNGDVTYEDLNQLPYLDCVIKETTRLYPSLPAYARRINKNIKCGKYDVPKGTDIAFITYAYHRNSNLYPNPEKFDPDRFRSGNWENRPWAHIAFSEGKRNCVGKKFALLELKVILVHVLRKFKVTALDRLEDINLEWGLSLKTVKPIRMKLDLRY